MTIDVNGNVIRYVVLYEGVRVATATAGLFSGPEISLYGVEYVGVPGAGFRAGITGPDPLEGHPLTLCFAEDDRAPILALTGQVGRDDAHLILYRRPAVPTAHVCPPAADTEPALQDTTEARIQILADALRGIAADTALPLSMSADGFEADYAYKTLAGAQAAARALAAHADAQWAAVQAVAKEALARAGEGAP